jgi:YD repeat-containing protein
LGQVAVTLTIPVPAKPSGAHYYLGDLAVAALAGVPHVFVASEAGLLIADVTQAGLVYPPAFTQQPAGVPAMLSAPNGIALHWARAIAFATLSGRDTVVVVGDDSAGQSSLFTVDVSDPSAPRVLGQVDLGLDGTGLVAVDVLVADETAIIGTQSTSGQGRTLFVSVSDPDAPLVAASLDGTGGHLAMASGGLLVSTARSAFGGATPLTGLRLTALDPVTATGATSCAGSVDLWTPRVSVQKTIDRVNDLSCSDPGRIAFVVCKPSRVSLTLEGSPLVASLDGAPETPLTDLALAPGLYVAHVSAAGLGDLKQPLSFEVKGVPDDGGALDVRPGVIELDVLNRAVLPVGRTFVKGVDLLDGHLVQQSTDLSLPGRHLGLQVTRTYSNAGPRPDGVMGPGWSWNFDAGLDETSCGLVNLSTADGSNQVFRTTDGGQTFVPQKGYHGSLRKTPAGLYVYTDKAAVEHTFEPVGGSIDPESYRLARVVEPHGDRLELSYDGRRRLIKVTERHAEKPQPVRTLELSYVQAGGYERVKEVVVKGPSGRGLGLTVRYQHDPATGNLERVTRSGENLPGGPPAEPRTESYEYEPSGQGLAGWRTRHRLRAAIDGNGNRVEYEFYTLDDDFPGPPTLEIVDQDQFVKRVRERASSEVEYETRFVYDFSRATTDQQWVTTVTDARQNDTVYVLNGNGSPTEVREALGRTTRAGWAANDVLKEWEEDPNQRVTRFTYDARGNVTSEGIETSDLGVVETAYEYHPRFNKLTLKRDPERREVTYRLDETTGDLRFVTDAVGNVTEHRYDSHGQLQVTVSPRGFETLYSDFHPITGSPRRVVDAEGNSTTSDFDDRGRLLAVSDSMGRRSTTTHDGLDRPTRVERAALYGQPDERTETTYFPAGQPKQVTTAAGLVSEFTLDGLNRVTRTEIRVPSVAGFPAESLVSTREYDGNGNVVVETDRRGVRERNVYDALNRLEATVLESGPDSGPLGEVARFTYDAVGNKRTETDVAGLVTEYAYDGLYRVSRKTFPQERAGNGEGRYDERYGYDRVGNRTRFEDANGRVTVTEYDGLNRVVRVTRDVGGLALVATTTYQDPEGSRVNKSEEHDAATGVRTTFTYDWVNRETQRIFALEGPGGDGAAYTTQTTYDDGDHAVEVRDPRQTVTRVLLDGLDREVERIVDVGGLELQTSRRHDAAGQVAVVTDARRNPSTAIHDALGRVRETTDAEGFVARLAYDGEGLKTLEVDRRGVSKRFTYDNLGRPRVSEVLPVSALSNLGQRTEILYDDPGRTRTLRNARLKDTVQHLDGMDRVVREVGPDGAEIVRTWDGVNKLSETDRRGNRTTVLYDGIDRLRQTTDPAPFQAQTVVTTYVDGVNRVEEKNRRGIVTVRQFDPLGRLRSVTRGGVLLEEHRYDGNSNKLSSRDADGRETRFEYDGANRLTAQVVGFGTADASRTEYSLDPNGNVTEERDARALARGARTSGPTA